MGSIVVRSHGADFGAESAADFGADSVFSSKSTINPKQNASIHRITMYGIQ